MDSTLIQHIFLRRTPPRRLHLKVHGSVRLTWDGLDHLFGMDAERHSGLGLEPMLTTSELAEYLGVHVQAIYDLRTDGRGPLESGWAGRPEYCISDVLRWLNGLHEPAARPGVGERAV